MRGSTNCSPAGTVAAAAGSIEFAAPLACTDPWQLTKALLMCCLSHDHYWQYVRSSQIEL